MENYDIEMSTFELGRTQFGSIKKAKGSTALIIVNKPLVRHLTSKLRMTVSHLDLVMFHYEDINELKKDIESVRNLFPDHNVRKLKNCIVAKRKQTDKEETQEINE